MFFEDMMMSCFDGFEAVILGTELLQLMKEEKKKEKEKREKVSTSFSFSHGHPNTVASSSLPRGPLLGMMERIRLVEKRN